MGSSCHMEVVVGGVVVEVIVDGRKVVVVDIFYFILINFLYYFNQMTKNINLLNFFLRINCR